MLEQATVERKAFVEIFKDGSGFLKIYYGNVKTYAKVTKLVSCSPSSP